MGKAALSVPTDGFPWRLNSRYDADMRPHLIDVTVFHASLVLGTSSIIGLFRGTDPKYACLGILLSSILGYVHRPQWLRSSDHDALLSVDDEDDRED